MEQLKVGTNDLPLVAKKKVVAAMVLVSCTKAFPMVGLALQLEMPMMASASIRGQKVGEECFNSGLDGRLEVVVASINLKAVAANIHLEAVMTPSKAARLRETLPTASRLVGPYENLITQNLTHE
jgi:hypothetical protein